MTDLSSHEVDTESDFVSDRDARSDFVGTDADRLSVIASDDGSRAASPALSSLPDDDWSIIGDDVDVYADESGGEGALVDSVQSLTLSEDVDATPRAVLQLRQRPFRSSAWAGRQGRSGSSPSRSPARRAAARRMHATINARAEAARARGTRSFYDYLFS